MGSEMCIRDRSRFEGPARTPPRSSAATGAAGSLGIVGAPRGPGAALTFVNVSPWFVRYRSLVMTCWHLRASSWDSLKQRASCSTAPFSIPQNGENSTPSSESSSRFFIPSGPTPWEDSAIAIERVPWREEATRGEGASATTERRAPKGLFDGTRGFTNSSASSANPPRLGPAAPRSGE